MEIKFKSIRVVDYENEKIYKRNAPETFEEYIFGLIDYIKDNKKIRNYKTVSNKKEVISCIKDSKINESSDIFEKNSDLIARRLLEKEKETQNLVARMKVSVKKGSLIQALLCDPELGADYYLLAKVEHGDFVDDFDYSFKTGFSKDKKTIWKTCLIDITNIDSECFFAKVFSDNEAKYWSKQFLELEEVNTDENNTHNAFDFIISNLNRNIKKDSPKDAAYLRNATIVYFRNHPHFNYYTMIDEVFENYSPYFVEPEKYNNFLEKIKTIPDKKNFDAQFSVSLLSIKSRVRTIQSPNPFIDVIIKDGIEEMENSIFSVEEPTGDRFLKIKITNDNNVYDAYKKS